MVVSGHAIIHPRIETELESANSTDFSLIFAGVSGCDPYCSLCGELYMDAFGSGGFAGKGTHRSQGAAALHGRALPGWAHPLPMTHLRLPYLRGAYMSDARVFSTPFPISPLHISSARTAGYAAIGRTPAGYLPANFRISTASACSIRCAVPSSRR